MTRLYKYISLFILIIITPILVWPETIRLKNGEIIVGEIIHKGKKILKVKTKYGLIRVAINTIVALQKNKQQPPLKLDSADLRTILFKNGEILQGYLVKRNRSYIKIRTLKGIQKISNNRIMKVLKKQKFSITVLDDKYPLWDVLSRSLLLPSWGQFRMKKIKKAWIIAGLMSSSVLLLSYSYISYKNNDDQYRDALANKTASSSLYESVRSSRKFLQVMTYTTIGLWLLNALDAAVFRKRDRNNFKIELSYVPKVGNSLLSTGIAVRF